jgi:hypothetical protein
MLTCVQTNEGAVEGIGCPQTDILHMSFGCDSSHLLKEIDHRQLMSYQMNCGAIPCCNNCFRKRVA